MSDNPSDLSADQPKIIIDEDWKGRVQAEKEALDRKKAAQGPAPSPPPGAQPLGELPPATLPVLMTTLATQALVALGQIAHPGTGKVDVRLDEAKHFIATLEMLEQKTTGNRTPDETRLLDNLLHELRLTFVTVGDRRKPSGVGQ